MQSVMTIVIVAAAVMALVSVWHPKQSQASQVAPAFTAVAAVDVASPDRTRRYSRAFDWGSLEWEVERNQWDKRRFGLITIKQDGHVVGSIWRHEEVTQKLFLPVVTADITAFVAEVKSLAEKDFPN